MPARGDNAGAEEIEDSGRMQQSAQGACCKESLQRRLHRLLDLCEELSQTGYRNEGVPRRYRPGKMRKLRALRRQVPGKGNNGRKAAETGARSEAGSRRTGSVKPGEQSKTASHIIAKRFFIVVMSFSAPLHERRMVSYPSYPALQLRKLFFVPG
jgi:hypothetical protein